MNWFPFVTQAISYLGDFGQVTEVLEPRPPRFKRGQHSWLRTVLGVRPSASLSTEPPLTVTEEAVLDSAVPDKLGLRLWSLAEYSLHTWV